MAPAWAPAIVPSTTPSAGRSMVTSVCGTKSAPPPQNGFETTWHIGLEGTLRANVTPTERTGRIRRNQIPRRGVTDEGIVDGQPRRSAGGEDGRARGAFDSGPVARLEGREKHLSGVARSTNRNGDGPIRDERGTLDRARGRRRARSPRIDQELGPANMAGIGIDSVQPRGTVRPAGNDE